MRNKISLILATMVTTLSMGSVAMALESESLREREGLGTRIEKKTEDSVRAMADDTAANTVKEIGEKTESRSERLEAHKAELRQKLEQKSVERKAKLEGRRLAQCQNRQDRINELLVKSNEVSNRHLENVRKFEAGIRTFAEKKSINSEAYLSLASEVDAKETIAVDTIKLTSAEQFDCLAVDAEKPTGTIKTVREAKRDALRDYRESVRQLLKLVKQEFSQSQSDKEVE